jgi:hypothetical protein
MTSSPPPTTPPQKQGQTESRAEESADIPIPPFDPSRFHHIPPQPFHLQWSPLKWRVGWHQTAGQLQWLLTRTPPTRRRGRSWQQSVELLQQQITLESGHLSLSLTVTLNPAATALHPTVLAEQTSPAPTVRVSLEWGEYAAAATLSGTLLTFPPVPLTAIGNGTTETISAPVNLIVETIP